MGEFQVFARSTQPHPMLPGGRMLAGGHPGPGAPNENLWLRSGDAGHSWEEHPAPPAIEYITEMDHFADDLIVLIGSGMVSRSLDGGASWEEIDPNVSGEGMDAVSVPSTTTAFFLARGSQSSSVYRSTDQGATWHLRETGLPASGVFYDLFFVDDETGFVGTAQQLGIAVEDLEKALHGRDSRLDASSAGDHHQMIHDLGDVQSLRAAGGAHLA